MYNEDQTRVSTRVYELLNRNTEYMCSCADELYCVCTRYLPYTRYKRITVVLFS